MADSGTDITHTLADALQKIENILADDRSQSHLYDDDNNDPSHVNRKISNCAQELRALIESSNTYLVKHIKIPPDTVSVLLKWLQTIGPTSSLTEDQYYQKFLRLENEKDSLLVQVGVLTDQLEVQGEKMRELEFTRDELQIKFTDLQEEFTEAEEKVCQSKHINEKPNSSQDANYFEVKNLKNEVEKRDKEIEDLTTHLETLLDEEERAKRHSSGSDSANLGLKAQLREKASEVSRLRIKLDKQNVLLGEKEKYIEEVKKQSVMTNGILDDGKPETNEFGNEDVFDDNHKLHQETSNKEDEESLENHVVTESDAAKNNNVHHVDHNSPFKRGPQNKSRSSFGKGFLKFRKTRSVSEPNLSPSEGETSDEADDKEKGKKKNLVGKMFGKLRRSNSHGFDAELKSHIGSGQSKTLRSDVPFSSWSAEMVASWLEDEGLGQYADTCTSHIQTGDDLIKMSAADLEKIFGIKKILHRKKLHLALQAVTDQSRDFTEHLDTHWVLDWLDDIGLPQYKDLFRDNAVDGRMLNYLTVNDLLQLKVYSTFHQHSLRRAIQCLRIHNFHPNYLKKSPIDESWQKGAHVVLWTNHRVTEWLRQADLSEYATNLRGSGVHGALMILEPRFTAESLATLLSIPIGKKLLRRHLATHFESLVGPACMKVKETASMNGLTPVVPGEKHKAIKKSLSIGGMKKRTKSDTDSEEYVCPMDSEVPLPLRNIFSPRLRKNNGGVPGNTDQRMAETKGQDELTKSLGTFSKELNSLTDMLGQETSRDK